MRVENVLVRRWQGAPLDLNAEVIESTLYSSFISIDTYN